MLNYYIVRQEKNFMLRLIFYNLLYMFLICFAPNPPLPLHPQLNPTFETTQHLGNPTFKKPKYAFEITQHLEPNF